MDITKGLIVGKDLANKINDTYVINNYHKVTNNPKVKIINHSNKNFIGQTGELIYKGKKYSMIKFNVTNEINNGNIPYYIIPIYKISNNCFEIINN